ncbi:MAG: hypothetical protein Q7S84_01000 [bacterium]|nr:hypothetical protein [bacterium]
MSINDLTLYGSDGRLHASLGSENDEIPESLMEYVVGFSLHETVVKTGTREAGIYKHETAEAEVEFSQYDARRESYIVKITGEKMGDVRELFHKIKAGSVRPDESYEGEQLGLSRKELEVVLERVTAELEQITAQQDSLAKLARNDNALRVLALELRSGFPFCKKESVAIKILDILNGVTRIRL